jgi:hypothetical protein
VTGLSERQIAYRTEVACDALAGFRRWQEDLTLTRCPAGVLADLAVICEWFVELMDQQQQPETPRETPLETGRPSWTPGEWPPGGWYAPSGDTMSDLPPAHHRPYIPGEGFRP